MAYSVPDLGYAFDALEPHIDARTMEIHHDKHHAAYVTNLNAALDGTGLDDQPVEQLIANLGQVPEDKRTAVRNNGGGHANHTLFWELMAPGGATGPSGALAAAVDAFGGLDALKAAVNDAGVKRFGSGWSWVVRDGDGLSVTSTPNQDSPVMDGQSPVLGVDVWEHAYYLNYQNRRPDYLAAWWNVVNWDVVGAGSRCGRRRRRPHPRRTRHVRTTHLRQAGRHVRAESMRRSRT
jgi:superoxide dismutase, Fe-Mn family